MLLKSVPHIFTCKNLIATSRNYRHSKKTALSTANPIRQSYDSIIFVCRSFIAKTQSFNPLIFRHLLNCLIISILKFLPHYLVHSLKGKLCSFIMQLNNYKKLVYKSLKNLHFYLVHWKTLLSDKTIHIVHTIHTGCIILSHALFITVLTSALAIKITGNIFMVTVIDLY